MIKIVNVLVVLLFISCGSKIPKQTYATEEELYIYNGPYYITFTFFPKNSHFMMMGGIGDTFNIENIKKDSLDNFIDSFYNQLVYFPIFIDEFSYKEYVNCLGYEISWDEKYSYDSIYSNLIEEYRITLEDGNYMIIRKYRILGDLNVEFVDDFKKCEYSISIELDINKIKAITRVAVLLDKEND